MAATGFFRGEDRTVTGSHGIDRGYLKDIRSLLNNIIHLRVACVHIAKIISFIFVKNVCDGFSMYYIWYYICKKTFISIRFFEKHSPVRPNFIRKNKIHGDLTFFVPKLIHSPKFQKFR